MDTAIEVEGFKSFIEANGNSPNVCAMYFKRVRTFLGKHPEAMEADEEALRRIIDVHQLAARDLRNWCHRHSGQVLLDDALRKAVFQEI